MFSSSIVNVAARNYGHKVFGVRPCLLVGLRQLTGSRRQSVLQLSQNLWSGRSLWKPCKRAISWPRRNSGEPINTSRGERELHQHCLQCEWGALTSAGDVVVHWYEYFGDFHNPTLTSSEQEDVKVTKVVEKLLGAPGVDEIHPEYPESLYVVGLSWDTSL